MRELPPGTERDQILEFVKTARLALDQTGAALRATANPVAGPTARARTDGGAVGPGAGVCPRADAPRLLALVLAAGALAGERDENVLGRLARGLVTPGRIVAANILLAAVVSAGGSASHSPSG